jgi:hypothetical protein
VVHIRRTITDLGVPSPDAAYQYSSLPLCAVDAVFSLGVRYESTERTVNEWCARYHWAKDRSLASEERTTSEFTAILQPYENRWEDMANEVFRNRQRTSARSGILKAEAVYRFSKALQKFGLESFADALKSGTWDDLRHAIKEIPGQGSGLSLKYFLILAGHTDVVKADRMVRRFVAGALDSRGVSPELAESLVKAACGVLRAEFPELTPSLLDNRIWKYQRDQDTAILGHNLGTLSRLSEP